MTRSVLARYLAFVLALVTGFGPGAAALAHGHAHQHLAAARAAARGDAPGHDHGHHAGGGVTDAARGADVIAAAGHRGDDHAHPRLDPSANVRGDLRLEFGVAALPAQPQAISLPSPQAVTTRLLTTAPPRAGPSATPPPPSRAPPLG